MISRFLAAALLLQLSAPALARGRRPHPRPRPPARPAHQFSLTFSPLHLVLPVFEVAGEYRVQRKLGLAGILGAGAMTQSGTQFSVLELGGQVRGYPVGGFDHGMQLGAEVLAVRLGSANVAGTGLAGTGTGISLGPFAGYKFVAPFGLTFDVQLGATYTTANASVSGSGASDASVLPLLNLDLGWSF